MVLLAMLEAGLSLAGTVAGGRACVLCVLCVCVYVCVCACVYAGLGGGMLVYVCACMCLCVQARARVPPCQQNANQTGACCNPCLTLLSLH